MLIAELAVAWLRDCGRAGARGDVEGAGARLLAAWGDPHRGHHDLTHLAEVLRHVEELAPHADDAGAVRLAAWFHDAVYDGRPGADEERSAALAEQVLAALGLPADRTAEVARLVRLTAGHAPPGGDRNGAVLCDADLAVLAADPERYVRYATGVRREYAHVPEAAFRDGRAAVLRGLLDRPALYRTPQGYRRWEEAARRNAAAELLLLDTAELSAGELSAGELSAAELSAGELSAGELSAAELSAGGASPTPAGG